MGIAETVIKFFNEGRDLPKNKHNLFAELSRFKVCLKIPEEQNKPVIHLDVFLDL